MDNFFFNYLLDIIGNKENGKNCSLFAFNYSLFSRENQLTANNEQRIAKTFVNNLFISDNVYCSFSIFIVNKHNTFFHKMFSELQLKM